MPQKEHTTSARPRLLLVDDDLKVAVALKRALKRDYDVVMETASRIALAHLQDGERYDAIVMDLAMPELSGEDLYTETLRIDPQQASKVLFVTGGAFTPNSQAFLASVSNPHIVKPFEMSALREAIVAIVHADDQSPTQVAALKSLASKFDLVALENDPSSAAFVDEGGSILWVNPAWRAFGIANGARLDVIGPGQNYFGAVKGELRSWFTEIATSCLESGGTFESDYECSSSSTKREFRMRVLPVPGSGLLITHTIRFETSHEHKTSEPNVETHVTSSGLLVMCSNCRRVRRNDNVTWDWIPSWLSKAPKPVSHGLCHLCLAFYFG